jgi:hypothetical protein
MDTERDNDRDDDKTDPIPNIETPGCWLAVVVMATAAALGATAARYIADWLEWLSS